MLKIQQSTNNGFILLVPDSFFWVTGRIARELSKKIEESGGKVIICSGLVLPALLARRPDFIDNIRLVHFLTPHLATKYKNLFYEKCIFVSTIHHIENEFSVEPAEYSDAIMTVSHQWHQKLVESGISSDRLVMLQNGIDADLFCPATKSKKRRARKNLGLPLDAFIVGFSAKRTSDSCDRKGVDVLEGLIKATAQQGLDDIVWLVRGPGWNDLVKSLQDSGGKIVYHPFLVSDEELAESYRALDAFIITSRIEGGPVPLLESMSSGLPVVTTRVGVAPEIIDDNSNAFLVDFNDQEAILGRLYVLFHKKSLADDVGKLARATILNKMQWKNTVKNMGKLYSVAEKNYIKRKEGKNIINVYKPYNFLKTMWLKRWIYAEECTEFSCFLKTQGAISGAKKMAYTACLHSFLDYRLFKKIKNYIKMKNTR